MHTRRRYIRMLLWPLFVFIFKRAVSFFLPISHPSSEVITTRSGSCSNSSSGSSSNIIYGTRCCRASVVVVVLLIVQMYFLRRTNYIHADYFIVRGADNRARRTISKQHCKPYYQWLFEHRIFIVIVSYGRSTSCIPTARERSRPQSLL